MALAEFTPGVQGREPGKDQRFGKIRQTKKNAVVVIEAPIAVLELRPAEQILAAALRLVDQLEGRRVERGRFPFLNERLLFFVQGRKQTEGLPGFHSRVAAQF